MQSACSTLVSRQLSSQSKLRFAGQNKFIWQKYHSWWLINVFVVVEQLFASNANTIEVVYEFVAQNLLALSQVLQF